MSQGPDQAAATPPLRWGAEDLWQQLEPLLPGLTVEVVAQIGSTNTTLLERARQSPADAGVPALLVAEQQTAGRGRQGKTWHTGIGDALTFSLALPLALRDWSGLSLAVGLALADALDPAAADQPARLGLKWPNDLLLRDVGGHAGGDPAPIGRKLGGILIETVQAGSQRIAVIGIGLNVRVLPTEALPPGLSWGRAAAQELWPGADAPAVLAHALPPLVQALRDFERDGFAPLQAGFARRDLLAGRAVTTTLAALPQGVADGVDASGTLWLRTADGTRHPVASGDVSLRPAAANTPATAG